MSINVLSVNRNIDSEPSIELILFQLFHCGVNLIVTDAVTIILMTFHKSVTSRDSLVKRFSMKSVSL